MPSILSLKIFPATYPWVRLFLSRIQGNSSLRELGCLGSRPYHICRGLPPALRSHLGALAISPSPAPATGITVLNNCLNNLACCAKKICGAMLRKSEVVYCYRI